MDGRARNRGACLRPSAFGSLHRPLYRAKLKLRLKVVAAMSRYHQLQADLEHCRKRVQYAERQLEDYTLAADLSTELAARTLRKLADDLKRAHDDTRWLQKELDDLMD